MQFDVWGKKNFAQELRLSFAGFCGRGRRAASGLGSTSKDACGRFGHGDRGVAAAVGVVAICASGRTARGAE